MSGNEILLPSHTPGHLARFVARQLRSCSAPKQKVVFVDRLTLGAKMSHSDFPEHAMEDTFCGVRMKKSAKQLYQYIQATDDVSDDVFHADELHDEVRNAKSKAADDTAREWGKLVVCSVPSFGSEELKRGPILATCVSLLALMVCGGLGVCLLLVDHKYSAQVDQLQQELRQLAHLCRSPERQYGHSGSERVALSAAGIAPGDQELSRPAPEVLSDDDTRLGLSDGPTWKQVQHTTPGRGDNFDFIAVDNSSDYDDDDDNAGQRGAADEEGVHRIWRRSAEHSRNRQKGICKKLKKCKKAQKRGRPLAHHCGNLLACLHKAQDKKDKSCEKVRACSKKGQPPRTAKTTQKQAPFYPKPVHFFSDFWNGLRQQEFGREACIYVRAWNATACRNRTVTLRHPYTPFKFLQGADWMKTWYKSMEEQPIKGGDSGGFQVQESGLYLLYSSVMFHDLKPRHSQAVVVNGEKRFKCMDSVDYVDADLPPGNNQAKYKTCAMTGVTHLSKGDRLEVQNLYDNTEIDLSTDATYFGAVLMAPGEVKPPKGNAAP